MQVSMSGLIGNRITVNNIIQTRLDALYYVRNSRPIQPRFRAGIAYLTPCYSQAKGPYVYKNLHNIYHGVTFTFMRDITWISLAYRLPFDV